MSYKLSVRIVTRKGMGHGGGSAVLGFPQVEQLPSWGIGHWAIVIYGFPASPCLRAPHPPARSPKLSSPPFFPLLPRFVLVGQLSAAPDYRCKAWEYLGMKGAAQAHPIHQTSGH